MLPYLPKTDNENNDTENSGGSFRIMCLCLKPTNKTTTRENRHL